MSIPDFWEESDTIHSYQEYMQLLVDKGGLVLLTAQLAPGYVQSLVLNSVLCNS